MPRRYVSERDFGLKVLLRQILWNQGYTTKINVDLGYEFGMQRRGRAGLTDLDVLGVRMAPGYRVNSVVSECKSGNESVVENLFWLNGVAQFFDADEVVLARSSRVPDHAMTLARSLDVSLWNQEDIDTLTSFHSGHLSGESRVWEQFFSAELVSDTLEMLGRLREAAKAVTYFQRTQYWMIEPHLRLTRTVANLRILNQEKITGNIATMVFANGVWLYVLALWKAGERLIASGVSRMDHNLKVYINGDESGLREMERLGKFVRDISRGDGQKAIDVPLFPPYLDELGELLTRCLRRPWAFMKLGQRSEWLLYGQLVGEIGAPPWQYDEDDKYCEKLLGDVALFLGKNSGVDGTILNRYMDLLSPVEVSARVVVEGEGNREPSSDDRSMQSRLFQKEKLQGEVHYHAELPPEQDRDESGGLGEVEDIRDID